MAVPKIPRRTSAALINSLSAGVVPRIGLEHIAVGREKEIKAFQQIFVDIAEGGAAFRFTVGQYGSGKSFLLQLVRNQAMEQGFVVADADLSPEHRLAGTNGQGLATYRELVRNIATKAYPNGGAMTLILERWISDIMAHVAKETGMRSHNSGFDDQVEAKILEAVQKLEGMVHGFDFAAVITAYWRGYRADDDDKKSAALRWLRGEFATKTEAKSALGVRVIIDDDNWYDYLKLFAQFIAGIGYKGLLIVIDEAVHLYKITHTISRQSNYDKLLAMFNDTMQGRVQHFGIVVGGTPQFLEDSKRGLFNDPAWQRRTKESRFVKQAGVQDTSGPVIQLKPLTEAEVFQLLQKLANVHTAHHSSGKALTTDELNDFVQEIVDRLGAEALLTPGEVVRDLMGVLNILQQNPEISFSQLIHGSDFQPTPVGKDLEVEDNSEFAEFTV